MRKPRTREPAIARMFVRDLVLPCLIGIHRHERDGRQRVRINVDLDVVERKGGPEDRVANVVNYHAVVTRIRELVAAGHVNLVETLAERIAALCLADRRVVAAEVRVEKLDVYADAASVGVAIRRKGQKSRGF